MKLRGKGHSAKKHITCRNCTLDLSTQSYYRGVWKHGRQGNLKNSSGCPFQTGKESCSTSLNIIPFLTWLREKISIKKNPSLCLTVEKPINGIRMEKFLIMLVSIMQKDLILYSQNNEK